MPKHSVSVAGIVVDDHGRVLVIRRDDNGRWEPPGGVLELDEFNARKDLALARAQGAGKRLRGDHAAARDRSRRRAAELVAGP